VTVLRTPTALTGGHLVAVLCPPAQPPEGGVAEQAGQGQTEDTEAGPPQPPFVAGAGARTVSPVVLLVSVLVQFLPAVVKGRLDAAHAGDAVHGVLGGAEAGVVTQPVGGERLGTGAGRAPAPPARHADDGVRGGGRAEVRFVTGSVVWPGRGRDHRYRVGQARH